MDLIDIARDFGTEEQCLAYLVQMHWPEGVRCVVCGSNRISAFERKNRGGKVKHLYQCLEPTCKEMFSACSAVRSEFSRVSRMRSSLNRWATGSASLATRAPSRPRILGR